MYVVVRVLEIDYVDVVSVRVISCGFFDVLIRADRSLAEDTNSPSCLYCKQLMRIADK